MTGNDPNPTPPVVPGNPAPGGNQPSPSQPYRIFQTEDQYRAAVNRKMANYVPKMELDTALQRATALESSVGTLQTEIQGLKTKISGYEIGGLRQKIGKEAGLPGDWIEELKGTDEKSLKEHAEALRKKLGIKQNAGNPVPPLTPGQPATESDEMNGMFISMITGGSGNR